MVLYLYITILIKKIGGKTKKIPIKIRGKLRYFVNDKEFCLFIRRNDETFTGIRGKDKDIIKSLKETFEWDWNNLPES